MRLDRINLAILSALQHDADISNKALAKQIGLSASACLERIKRLKASGVIARISAQIDMSRLGAPLIIFAEVTMRTHVFEDFRAFEAFVRQSPDIIECHKISGAYDYWLRFACRDMVHYHALSEAMIDKGLGIDKFVSRVALDATKPLSAIALENFVTETTASE